MLFHPHRALDDIRPHVNDASADYTGTSGDDTQTGTGTDEIFDYSQGGNDTLNGAGGNDTFRMGAAFTGADTINGGDGNDTIVIDVGPNAGDFIDTNATSFTSIETMRFVGNGGDEYEIYIDDGNIAAGATMTFDTTSFKSTDSIYVNASPDTDGNVVYKGGAGGDLFSSSGGANDFMGGGGNDNVDFIGTELDANDRADGGKGNDTLTLIFPTGGDLTLGDNVTNFETLSVYPGFTDPFSITTNDANVAKGHTLTVDMYDHDRPLVFDGSAETDGRFVVYGGTGRDHISGGARDDVIDLVGGSDTAYGGGGDDVITVDAYVTRKGFLASGIDETDRIDGGAGHDTLIIGSAPGLNEDSFKPNTIHNIETVIISEVSFEGPDNFGLSLDDANVGSGQTITIDASSLGQIGDAVRFFLISNQTDSFVHATGGASDDFLEGGGRADMLAGGAGNDELEGLGGGDLLDGGSGEDLFVYQAVSELQGKLHDTITGFDGQDDSFRLDLAVSAVASELTSGQLREAHFTGDLGVVLSGLAANNAVLFTPDDGDDAGKVYLIVNDGVVGYQAKHDYVIELDGGAHLNALTAGDFVLAT